VGFAAGLQTRVLDNSQHSPPPLSLSLSLSAPFYPHSFCCLFGGGLPIYVRVHVAFYYLNLPLPAKILWDLWHDLVLCAVSLKFN